MDVYREARRCLDDSMSRKDTRILFEAEVFRGCVLVPVDFGVSLTPNLFYFQRFPTSFE